MTLRRASMVLTSDIYLPRFSFVARPPMEVGDRVEQTYLLRREEKSKSKTASSRDRAPFLASM